MAFARYNNGMHIGVLIGSLRKESYNRKVFHALQTLAPRNVTLTDIPLDTLPLYNEDTEDPLPQAVQEFKQALAEKDAILFVSPEYNRSVPGVLKNAIDWSTRGEGGYVLDTKPGAVIGATTGRLGTAPMQAHLHNVMLHVGMRVIGQPEVYVGNVAEQFNDEGVLTSEKTRAVLQKFIDTFVSEARMR